MGKRQSNGTSKDKKNNKPFGKTMAQLADRHVLYEKSVQDPESEYKFISKVFRKLRNRKPHAMREDFCGTANMASYWVAKRQENTAIGVDLDAAVLKWGKKHHLDGMDSDQQSRIRLLNENVLTVNTESVDVILAFNFSYYLFKQRDLMRQYFSRVRDALHDDGIFFLDAFGGYESFQELEEPTKHKKFTYIWDQAKYNPITGDMRCHIHFTFPDGSKLRPAFTYEWRMWTLPEIQEILHEAGFSNVTIYWEGTDKHGDGNGDYRPTQKGDADAGWVCYLTAEK